MHFCVSLLTSGLTHSRPRSRWPRTAYISVLAQSHRSMPPSLWRHRRARVIAHHTSPLYLLLLLLIHPSVPSLPPLSLSFPCHRVHCVNVAFTVKYSRCLYSFLSSLPPSAFFTSSCFPCSRGGRNVNVASSSKLVFSPSLLSSFFISFFSRKILCKCLWTRATKPCCI